MNVPLWTMGSTVRPTPANMNSLVSQFQSRLLAYRLSELSSVANSTFDAPEYCPQVRLLAQQLGAIVQGSRLQTELMTALARVDGQRKQRQLPDRTAVVLEALLLVSHRKIAPVYVATVAEITKSITILHGDNYGLTARAVGPIIRDQLGIETHRRSAGTEVLLNRDGQARLHQLASVCNLLEHVPECEFCRKLSHQ